MREIKFRGKRRDNGEWVYGDLINHRDNRKSICPDPARCGYASIEGYSHEVIPETVGQFTGLTDKDGFEIYEGDIVRTNSHNVNVVNSVHEIYKWEIGPDMTQYMYLERYPFIVLGNIHDNPELLERK